MKILLAFSLIAVGVAYYFMGCCNTPKNQLFLFPDNYAWGVSKDDGGKINKFELKVSQKDIEDLKTRLANWRRHERIPNQGRFYGISENVLENLVKYWREKYDFTKFEAKINSMPQFTTVIQGLKVHFIHAKADSTAKKVIPLLIVHGWPGSVVEFYRAIPLLTKPDKNGVAFEVVAPSIPGFGFSEAAAKPGFNLLATGQVFQKLMKRLGHEKFIYQGGDWGSLIGQVMSRMYPENIIGYHSNFMSAPLATVCQKLRFFAAKYFPKMVVDEQDVHKLGQTNLTFFLEESGYFHIQATKPDTLGVAMADSPVALMAWIGEKFEVASDHAEMLGHSTGISNDDFFHNIMVYWISNHAVSASRFYK